MFDRIAINDGITYGKLIFWRCFQTSLIECKCFSRKICKSTSDIVLISFKKSSCFIILFDFCFFYGPFIILYQPAYHRYPTSGLFTSTPLTAGCNLSSRLCLVTTLTCDGKGGISRYTCAIDCRNKTEQNIYLRTPDWTWWKKAHRRTTQTKWNSRRKTERKHDCKPASLECKQPSSDCALFAYGSIWREKICSSLKTALT